MCVLACEAVGIWSAASTNWRRNVIVGQTRLASVAAYPLGTCNEEKNWRVCIADGKGGHARSSCLLVAENYIRRENCRKLLIMGMIFYLSIHIQKPILHFHVIASGVTNQTTPTMPLPAPSNTSGALMSRSSLPPGMPRQRSRHQSRSCTETH